MSDIAITFAVIGAMVLLFVSNRVPVALVALCAALVLHATGILELSEALAGFGDTTVLFIASLFVVSASLDASGVTAWVGQVLVRQAGSSRERLLLLAAMLTAMIGSSGAAAALLPVLVLVAVRLRQPAAQLMMPLAFASYSGSMLVLTGSLVNVLISDAAVERGMAPFAFFEMSVIGVALLIGHMAIVLVFGAKLLPQRSAAQQPRHAGGSQPALRAPCWNCGWRGKIIRVSASLPSAGRIAWGPGATGRWPRAIR